MASSRATPAGSKWSRRHEAERYDRPAARRAPTADAEQHDEEGHRTQDGSVPYSIRLDGHDEKVSSHGAVTDARSRPRSGEFVTVLPGLSAA
ncbi:MAG: hypothetical protein ACLR7Z_20990 [Bilophila wadsworthia]